ncbi:MAG: hypothetical protein WCG00_17285, partial [Hyphomicrobiales bacterium]
MSAAAKKLVIVHNDDAPALPEQTIEILETVEFVEVSEESVGEPAPRAEELRLLEALLFAA